MHTNTTEFGCVLYLTPLKLLESLLVAWCFIKKSLKVVLVGVPPEAGLGNTVLNTLCENRIECLVSLYSVSNVSLHLVFYSCSDAIPEIEPYSG